MNVDRKHAAELIGSNRDDNDKTIDYKDLYIGADFMLKELIVCDKNKSSEVAKFFTRKKKWDQMAQIDTVKNINDIK